MMLGDTIFVQPSFSKETYGKILMNIRNSGRLQYALGEQGNIRAAVLFKTNNFFLQLITVEKENIIYPFRRILIEKTAFPPEDFWAEGNKYDYDILEAIQNPKEYFKRKITNYE